MKTRASLESPEILELVKRMIGDPQNLTRVIIDLPWGQAARIYTESMVALEPLRELLELMTPSDALRGRE